MNIKKVGNDFIIIYMCKQFFIFFFYYLFLRNQFTKFSHPEALFFMGDFRSSKIIICTDTGHYKSSQIQLSLVFFSIYNYTRILQ